MHPAAQEIIDLLNSYTEHSPGADGIHVFTLGCLPPHAKNRYTYKGLGIELYDSGRYATLTGHCVAHTPTDVVARQEAINELIARFQAWERENTVVGWVEPSSQPDTFSAAPSAGEQERASTHPHQGAQSANRHLHLFPFERQPSLLSAGDLPRADQQVLLRARAARNAPIFHELWSGGDPKHRTKRDGQPDESAADFDLVLMLLYWTGDDPEQTERLFRASARYRAEKTDARRGKLTYLQKTIHNALARRHTVRQPPRKPEPEPPTTPPATPKGPQHRERRIIHAHAGPAARRRNKSAVSSCWIPPDR